MLASILAREEITRGDNPMLAPTDERMSRVDTAWLRMDNDVNLMMIVGVWLLQPAITLAALRERVGDKLLKYDRFRQKVVEDTMGARWVTDDRFDLANHVVPHALKRRRGQSERAALQDLVGRLSTTPLDRAHPLWQFHFIESYEGGSALIARVHHCIADGIALISVMLSITEGGAARPRRREGAREGAALLRQRRAAGLRRGRHWRLAARPRGRSRGQGDPCHGAGEPAPARQGLAARQPVRPGAARAADRHREPGGARVRGAPAHERAEGKLPAGAGLRRSRGRRAAHQG